LKSLQATRIANIGSLLIGIIYKFHIGEFLKALEERIKCRDNLEVNVRAEVFVQNMVNALDIVAPKKKFKIPKIWKGKK